jgi:hypothetical protein
MTSETRELFREALLRVLEDHASDRFGLGVRAIRVFMAEHGFKNPEQDQLNAELIYLRDKNFTAIVGKQISPENTSWRITADGRDFLAQGGA